MIKQEVTIHIACPVEKVFAFLADAKNLRAWQSNLIENQQLTEGTVRVGTQFREVRRMGPRQTEIRAEITAYDINKSFATKTLTKPQVTVDYALEREADGTRLNYKFVMVTSGITRLLEPLIAGSIKKDNDLDFKKLKLILEG